MREKIHVSQKDKVLFKKIGQALNPPKQALTKLERIKQFPIQTYFDFLQASKSLATVLQKNTSSTLGPSIAHACFQRAVRLGLITRGKISS